MKIQFLGGVDEVGRLGMVLDYEGARLLFDYGMAPEKPPEYPMECPPIDAAFLSHAHLDHSGMLPWIGSRYDAPIFATPPSARIATLLHNDSYKIAGLEGYPAPYEKTDIKRTEQLFQTHGFGQTSDVGNLAATCHPAGHIPGASMWEVQGDRTLLFTGDLYTRDSRLVKAAKPVRCDTLVLESTYAGREHPPRDQVEKEFLGAIEETIDRGGTAIVPTFAVGRAQEIMLLLKNAGFEVWLDGMAKTVTTTYLDYGAFVKNRHELQAAYDEVRVVHSTHGRKLALNGEVILTTSGMLDGGPVLWYLDHLRDDPESSVFLTGYQVEGSNGRRLLDTGHIEVQGVSEKIECRVRRFDFSAHAGHSDLVAFAKACGAKDVVLMHGDHREKLVDDMSEFATVHLPVKGEVVEL